MPEVVQIQESPVPETVPILISGSPSDHSSKWSITTSNLAKDDSGNSIANYDEDPQKGRKGCGHIVSLFKCLFHSRHKRKPSYSEMREDEGDVGKNSNSFQHSIFLKILENVNLLNGFITSSLIPKLESYLESCAPEKTVIRSCNLSLPSAEVWTVTNLMELLSKTSDKGKQDVLGPYRKSMMSLCWDMEMTRKVGLEFFSKFTEFTNCISGCFRELRGVLKTYPDTNFKDTLNLRDPLHLNPRLSPTKEKPTVALEINSSFFLRFPVVFKVETWGKRRTQSFSSSREFLNLDDTEREQIICELFKSAMKSLEKAYSVLESSSDRIQARGVIIKGPVPSKDVTCQSTIKLVKNLFTKLILKRRQGLHLSSGDADVLIESIVRTFGAWNKYLEVGQQVLMKFFELCDMTSVCYSFCVHHLKMNIPQLSLLQKEVDLALQAFSKKGKVCGCKCPFGNLKHYALITLMEETATTEGDQSGRSQGNYYQRLMRSTRYHLLLRQFPLDVEGENKRFRIVLRSKPDLENKESDMVFNLESGSIIISIPDAGKGEGVREIREKNIFETKLTTFSIQN